MQFTQLADCELTLEGENLVTQIAEQANRGDKGCAAALVGWSTPTAASEEAATHPPAFSQALAWSAEPEWQGESSEAEAETAIGSREPEILLR